MTSICKLIKIDIVLTVKDLIAIIWWKIQSTTQNVVKKPTSIWQSYMLKVKISQQSFPNMISQIVINFSKLNDIHLFYAGLTIVFYDKDHNKGSLGQKNITFHLIDKVSKDDVPLLQFGDSLFLCDQLECAALGRMATIMKQKAQSLQSREKCDEIISIVNGKLLPGSTLLLIVKVSDGGSKDTTSGGVTDCMAVEVELLVSSALTTDPASTIMSSSLSSPSRSLDVTCLTKMHIPSGPKGVSWLMQYVIQPPMHQQMEMLEFGMDPSLQYFPQLKTYLSSLHVGPTENPYQRGPGKHGHHHYGGYPLYTPDGSAAAADIIPSFSLVTESDQSESVAATSDEPSSYGAKKEEAYLGRYGIKYQS